MADKKSPAAVVAHEEVEYTPEAAAPVAVVEAFDTTKLNTLSVVSLATAATGFGAVAGVVTGHVALSQLRRSGEKGRGLALAGLITGYVGIAGFTLMAALSVGGHWAQNRFDDGNRGFISNSQSGNNFGGMMGGNGRGQDDQNGNGWGMMGGNGQIQSGQGQVQVVPNSGAQGGTITLDSNGNQVITLPNGQTITLPDGNGMMGGKGFGPQGGQVQVVPVPSATAQTN